MVTPLVNQEAPKQGITRSHGQSAFPTDTNTLHVESSIKIPEAYTLLIVIVKGRFKRKPPRERRTDEKKEMKRKTYHCENGAEHTRKISKKVDIGKTPQLVLVRRTAMQVLSRQKEDACRGRGMTST